MSLAKHKQQVNKANYLQYLECTLYNWPNVSLGTQSIVTNLILSWTGEMILTSEAHFAHELYIDLVT